MKRRQLIDIVRGFGSKGASAAEVFGAAYPDHECHDERPARGQMRCGRAIRALGGTLSGIAHSGALLKANGRYYAPEHNRTLARRSQASKDSWLAPAQLVEGRAAGGCVMHDGRFDRWEWNRGSFVHFARDVNAPPLHLVPPIPPRVVQDPSAPNGLLLQCGPNLWCWQPSTGTHVFWRRAS